MGFPDTTPIHARERAYFDAVAANSKIRPFDRYTIGRYAHGGSLYPLEWMYSVVGELAVTTVLDVGCGDGENVAMLAKLGADVTGVDLSPGAIAAAHERCRRNRVSAQLRCCPVEELPEGEQYGVVWVDALLHHVTHCLDQVMVSLVARVRPGGIIAMMEPVNLFAPLRRIRLRIGAPDGTPDERPLEPHDLAVIRRRVPGLQSRYFRCFGRLQEVSPHLVTPAAYVDAMVLRIPGMWRFASIVVMWAKV
jgi:SAM-dependent methyltransferase